MNVSKDEARRALQEAVAGVEQMDVDIAAAEDERGLPRSSPSDPLDWRLKRIGCRQAIIDEVMRLLAMLDNREAEVAAMLADGHPCGCPSGWDRAPQWE